MGDRVQSENASNAVVGNVLSSTKFAAHFGADMVSSPMSATISKAVVPQGMLSADSVEKVGHGFHGRKVRARD